MKKTEKTYYDNGNIKEEFEVNTKGDRHGITRMYHDNGQLKFSMTHKNGKQTPGVVISYHNNGVKAREVTLAENGNLNGDFKEWHNNGSIRHEGYYKEDKCFIHKEYDKDGLLIDFKSRKHNNETIREAVKEWLDDAVSAEAKYGHISGWDTSEVTDMSKLFLDAYTFNENINNWNVSNVTNMHAMFDNAYLFDQPLDKWDVGNVTNMSEMFSSMESLAFNQPLNNWDVSNVTDMRSIFGIGNEKMIEKYGVDGGNLISNIEEESYENIESDFKNKSNDNETMSMSVTFSNTIFSEHPNTSLLIEKCDNSSSDFVNMSNNCIEGEFEIPAELRNYIEVLKYDIDTSEAFSNSNNYLTMDIDCTVTISIKTTKDEAIDAIEKYQEDNNDLRWSLSIKWIDADKKEQYSFDSWDVDMLEEIIEDEPCWYVED